MKLKNKKDIVIDKTDSDIISILQKDALLSSDKISKKLNITASTIRRRVRNLIKNKVIRVVAVADPTKIGYPVMAEIHMELNHKAEKAITEYLASFDEIKSIFFLTGRFNCRALAAFKSNDEFQKFMRTVIANIDGLNSVETHIYLEIMKGQFWFWCHLD